MVSVAERAVGRARREYREATTGLRRLPDFLIVGAQRAGSTSLYTYLTGHPLVLSPTHKEIHFFDLNWQRGPDWYRRHFPTRASGAVAGRRLRSRSVTGEASPYYLFHPHAPARVRELLPEVRLVALLRDPVARAYSHFQLEHRNGNEPLSFEEALEAEPERIGPEQERLENEPGYASWIHRHFAYLARGRYAEQLERWLAVFPRAQLLVLASEDFFADPEETVRQVASFIGLPAHALPSYPAYNQRPYDAMRTDTREFLRDYFREPNRRLAALLGRDFAWDDS